MNDDADTHEVLTKREVAALDRALTLIEGATSLPHFLGSLWIHLCGTWKILDRHAYGRNVSLAGLLHSIYSTEHYGRSLFPLEHRYRVTATVGSEVEKLAYYYCASYKKSVWGEILENHQSFFVRSRFDDRYISLTRDDAGKLLQIACADWIEQCAQSDGSPKPFMAWFFRSVRSGYLKFNGKLVKESEISEFTETKEEMSIRAYNAFLNAVEPVESNLCEEAVLLNPFSAELRIFLAIQQYHRRDIRIAELNFLRARILLASWGTAWDKRLTCLEWEMVLASVEARITQENATFLLDQIISSTIDRKLPEFVVGVRATS